MDGSEVKVLADVEPNSVNGLTVDPTTLILYWTDEINRGILQCDLQGNNHRVLIFSPRPTSPLAIDVRDGVAYWQEGGFRFFFESALIHAPVEREKPGIILPKDEPP